MSGGGWSVKWAPLGSDESLRLLREGWQPFAVVPTVHVSSGKDTILLVLRRYNLPGDAE